MDLHYSNTPPDSYRTVGTLGDDPEGLTCSIDAARRWGKAEHLIGYASFEFAGLDVKTGRIESFLLPAAYPGVGAFLMDSDLQVSEVFLTALPPLVLAGRDEVQPASVNTVFHHPATTPLLREVPIKYRCSVPVTSNPRACEAVLESADSAVAVTNMLSADHYGLFVYRVLRRGIRMPFIVLVKA